MMMMIMLVTTPNYRVFAQNGQWYCIKCFALHLFSDLLVVICVRSVFITDSFLTLSSTPPTPSLILYQPYKCEYQLDSLITSQLTTTLS